MRRALHVCPRRDGYLCETEGNMFLRVKEEHNAVYCMRQCQFWVGTRRCDKAPFAEDKLRFRARCRSSN